jgi:hypothetical protein
MQYLGAFCGKIIDWHIFAVFPVIEYLRMNIGQWVSAPKHRLPIMSGIFRSGGKCRPCRLLPPFQIT